jgi:hypothetical protein
MEPVEDNAHAPMKLAKRRLLVNSTDRTSGTSTDFTINLSPALQNIVSSDWVYTSQPGYLLQMDNFTQTGTTSGTGSQYWRYLGENINNRYSKTAEAFELPGRNYNTLGIHWRNKDGSVATGKYITGSTVTTSTLGAGWITSNAYDVGNQVVWNGLLYSARVGGVSKPNLETNLYSNVNLPPNSNVWATPATLPTAVNGVKVNPNDPSPFPFPITDLNGSPFPAQTGFNVWSSLGLASTIALGSTTYIYALPETTLELEFWEKLK